MEKASQTLVYRSIEVKIDCLEVNNGYGDGVLAQIGGLGGKKNEPRHKGAVCCRLPAFNHFRGGCACLK